MKHLTLAAALLLATVSSSSWAQSPADHEAHHPDQKEAPAAAQPTPPAGQPGMGGSQGMMGGGGMMNMMNMMGSRMPMMDMTQMMGRMGMTRQSGCGTGGMATIDRVEGRIAFLRTELKITDTQTSAWNAFADALRTNAKNLGEVRASMSQAGTAPQSLVDRLTLQEKWLATRLEGTRAIKSALTNLVSTVSDDQKKTADEILALHMGMTAMMCPMQMRRGDSDRMGRDGREMDRGGMMGRDGVMGRGDSDRMSGDRDMDRGQYSERGDRDWDRADRDRGNRGYSDEDRPRRRVKVCVEYENGDEYCRYKE
jgi:hypothetical protein